MSFEKIDPQRAAAIKAIITWSEMAPSQVTNKNAAAAAELSALFERAWLTILYGSQEFSFDDVGALLEAIYLNDKNPANTSRQSKEVYREIEKGVGKDHTLMFADQLNGLFACRDFASRVKGLSAEAVQAREQLYMVAIHRLFHTPMVGATETPELRASLYPEAIKKERRSLRNIEKLVQKTSLNQRHIHQSVLETQKLLIEALTFNNLIFSDTGVSPQEAEAFWRQWWQQVGESLEKYDQVLKKLVK